MTFYISAEAKILTSLFQKLVELILVPKSEYPFLRAMISQKNWINQNEK